MYEQTSTGKRAVSAGHSFRGERVARGGNFNHYSFGCRSAHRFPGIPTFLDRHTGFRVALEAVVPNAGPEKRAKKSDAATSRTQVDSNIDDFFVPDKEKPSAADDFFDDGMSQNNPLDGSGDLPSGVRVIHGHSGYWGQFAVSPDGRFIASGTDDRAILFWDLETGRELWKSRPFDSMVFALCFSPKGDQLWAGGGSLHRLLSARKNAHLIRCRRHHPHSETRMTPLIETPF